MVTEETVYELEQVLANLKKLASDLNELPGVSEEVTDSFEETVSLLENYLESEVSKLDNSDQR